MTLMTIDDLVRILAECAGAADGVQPGDDVTDMPFEELGYDSLALIETAARIEQDYGVEVPEDDLAGLQTPRALLDAVNRNLAEAP